MSLFDRLMSLSDLTFIAWVRAASELRKKRKDEMQVYFNALVDDRKSRGVCVDLDDYGVSHIWDYLSVVQDYKDLKNRQSCSSYEGGYTDDEEEDELSEYIGYTVPPEEINCIDAMLSGFA